MILLTLTTSTDRGGFAIFKNQKLVVEKTWMRKVSSSEMVIPTLQKALKSKKILIKDISGICLDIGPGSFTGCRISACVAKTLGEGLDIPVYTTTSLDALIFQNKGQKSKELWALLDAHKSLLYAMHFDGKNASGVLLLDLNAIQSRISNKVLVAGIYPSGMPKFLKPSKNILNFPQPQTLGKMFFADHPSIKKLKWSSVEPLYIRAPQVIEKTL